VGIAQGALDKTISYVRQRKQFGKALAEFQFVQFKMAELATKIEAARNLYMKAALAIDRNKPNHVISAMAKWYGGEIAVEGAKEIEKLIIGRSLLKL
jgi:acyl-CoA dehydrogenase